MKNKVLPILIFLISFLPSVRAAIQLIEFGEFGSAAISAEIPDNNLSGLARNVNVVGHPINAPYDVTVSFKIKGIGFGAINGDYYAYLKHFSTDGSSTRLAILLNRLGRSNERNLGYFDNGMDVTLQDSATHDIHSYRLALHGSHNNPVNGELTGIWQADGRNLDPSQVLDTSVRTTSLSQLGVGDPNGIWTFFVADANAGGIGQLLEWKVTLQGVPEPGAVSLLTFGFVILSALKRGAQVRKISNN